MKGHAPYIQPVSDNVERQLASSSARLMALRSNITLPKHRGEDKTSA